MRDISIKHQRNAGYLRETLMGYEIFRSDKPGFDIAQENGYFLHEELTDTRRKINGMWHTRYTQALP